MQEERLNSVPLRFNDPRTEAMLEPEEVSAILRLNELGWGGQTDCPRTRDQPQHGQGLHRGRRLDAVPTTAAQKEGIDPVRSYQEGPRVSIRSTARCAAPLCEMQRPAGVAKDTSRAKGSHRKLEALVAGRQRRVRGTVRIAKSRSR